MLFYGKLRSVKRTAITTPLFVSQRMVSTKALSPSSIALCRTLKVASTVWTGCYTNSTNRLASQSLICRNVVTPSVPKVPATESNNSGSTSLHILPIDPLARTNSTQWTVSSNNPCLNELLSAASPARPPPTVIPGNSGTTRGSNLCSSVAFVRLPKLTFGSTSLVFLILSKARILERPLVSISVSRWKVVFRTEFVVPW